jgi:hypothetical protein
MEHNAEEQEAPTLHRGVIITTPKGPLRIGWRGAQREGLTGREVWYLEYPEGSFSGNYPTREAAYADQGTVDFEGVEL